MKESNTGLQVLGVKVTKNKEGKVFSKLVLRKDYEPWEIESALYLTGDDVVVEYTSLDCSSLKEGEFVELFYRKGFQGKAVLAGFQKVTGGVKE